MIVIVEVEDSEGNRVKQRLDLPEKWEMFSVWTVFLIIRGLFGVNSNTED